MDQFESMIAIKGGDRTVSSENQSYRNHLLQGKSAIGKTLDDYLLPDISKTAQATDNLIVDGVPTLELEHLGIWDIGQHCIIRTFKKSLHEFASPEFRILVISRFKEFVNGPVIGTKRSLSEYVALFQGLDSIDQTICRRLVHGDATRDIANRVGLTPRSVELRRQKVLDLLGLQRPIEIVKLFVRLEENGLLEGWC